MRGLSSDTKLLIAYALKLLSEYHPQTLRQLHYAIFSRSEIDYDNDQFSYKRLSRATTTARRLYREYELLDLECDSSLMIPPEWMVDETRQGETVSVWTDAAAYCETVKRCYRRDNWQDQEYHVEVWGEKSTILGAIRPVTNEWGITLRVSHGFASCGMEMSVGDGFARIDKEIVVFYLGDHDPAGT